MTDSTDLGPIYAAMHAKELERADRANPIPGGEPQCPVCGAKTARLVESHPSPHSGESPFKVRLICSGEDCRRWTIYSW